MAENSCCGGLLAGPYVVPWAGYLCSYFGNLLVFFNLWAFISLFVCSGVFSLCYCQSLNSYDCRGLVVSARSPATTFYNCNILCELSIMDGV